jgi:phage repressor protein C with HTH and peptisase S24 domain
MFEELLDALLKEGQRVRFTARGESMRPAIADGEAVVVEPLTTLCPGEIFLYRGERGLRAHRLLRIEGEHLIFRGDRAVDDDPPVPRETVAGRVIAVERGGREVGLVGMRARVRWWLDRARRRISRPPSS